MEKAMPPILPTRSLHDRDTDIGALQGKMPLPSRLGAPPSAPTTNVLSSCPWKASDVPSGD
jgi:hypothetical protein